MSTLAIPPKRVRLYRVLWDRWIIVLRIMFELGAGAHPVKWRAVADTLLVDKKTCQKYIGGLVRDGHLALAGDGYMLTTAGMSILAETDEGEIPSLEGKNTGEKFSPLKESVEVVNSELKSLTTSTSKLGEIPGEIFSPEVQQALAYVHLLFDGGEVTQNGLPTYLHIEKVIGWIAYIYDRRADIRTPCGLLYSKLKDPTSPSPSVKYMKDPCHFLPENYLSAIGRFEKTCNRCEGIFTNISTYEAHRETCLYIFVDETSEENKVTEPDETVTEQVSQAWQTVLDRLRKELPKASFLTWVEETQPVHFDGSVLQVGARNRYATDWLSKNIQQVAVPLLSEALGSTVGLDFVAVETMEE